jgi:hypothetical protein
VVAGGAHSGNFLAFVGGWFKFKLGYLKGQDIIFHSFPKPKDMVSQTMRNEWINRCKREDKLNPETSRICSKHFVETDYERDLQNELLGKNIIILSLFEPNIKAHLNLYLNNTDFHCKYLKLVYVFECFFFNFRVTFKKKI